jgi:hypothetical protein
MHGSPRGRAVRLSLLLATASGLSVLSPSLAHADAASEKAAAKDLYKPPERRGGLIFGFGMGVGVAGASGYPNNSSDIGVAAYYDGSNAMGGYGALLFAMGSLSDWLSFGVFYGRENFRSGQWYSYGGGGGFRVDLFPLYYLHPVLRDLGIYGQFGVGTSTLLPTTGTREGANGTESFLGTGAFYEFFLGKAWHGHFAAGPAAELDTQITQSNQRFAGIFGGRVAFYTGK